MSDAPRPFALFDRVRRLGPEATKFGIVGLTGVALQIVVFNLLRYAGPGGVGAGARTSARRRPRCRNTTTRWPRRSG